MLVERSEGRKFSRVDSGIAVEEWIPSTCGLCSIGCGLDIARAGGRIVGVRGRATDKVAGGRLGPKGLNQWYANRHPARALLPKRRTPSGKLEACSWDDAMEAVVKAFNEAIALSGPDAVAIYNSGQLLLEEYYTIAKIARGGLGISNIDANTRLCTATTAASLMENFGADGPPGCYADFDETDCIVLIGHNAAEQSTVLWMRILAAKDGVRKPKVIVIDPRRTLTVETGADLHLQPRPGTNVALLNGLANLLIENGWIDRQFVSDHAVEFEEFCATAAQYPPSRVEEICGVPQDLLRRAAEWIGKSERTVTTCLQGVYQFNQATAAACLVNSIHILMGKIGKPGCAPFQFAGQPSSMNTREAGADGTYPAYRNWEDQNHMKDLAKRWHVPVELLGKKPVSTPEIFEMVEKGYVKVLWTIGTNPAVSMMDRRKQLAALRDVFLIVQDCFEDTETARFADVLLPAAMWGEKEGCMTNAERRCNHLRKAVDPPGQARSDLDIFLDFARRMRLRDKKGEPLVAYTTSREAFEEWRQNSKGWIPDYSGMTYELLDERGGIQWPCNEDHPDGTERLYGDRKFPTDWKIAESYRKDLQTGHERTLKEYRDQKDPEGKAVLIRAEYEPPLESPDDDYPLVAVTGRQVYHWHTRTKTGRAPVLDAAAPGVFVSVSREDAQQLGIRDGEPVRVVSRRGEMTGPAKIGDLVPRGVVFVPFHYGDLGEGTAANDLTPKIQDPVSKQPVQKGAAVRLEKASGRINAWWSSPQAERAEEAEEGDEP
jgi:ferredoxin-nitrate reductase